MSCQNNTTKPIANNASDTTMVVKDYHTLSNADSIIFKHLDLSLVVNMQDKKIEGKAIWHIENVNNKSYAILDDANLKIDSVWVDDKQINFKIGNSIRNLGTPLEIPINNESKKITIKYATSPGAKALQWLDAAQTTGKKHPFLYTQSESIHARSWIPCPDGPGVRFTYTAKIKVPQGMIALMSANGNPQQSNDSNIYHFNMDIPIPPYLMALSVGDISFKKIGNNTGVYAEPEMIDKAAYELADLEKLLQTAESLYGKYRWGRYDVLVLPAGFPIGGMENPKLTFCTPTIIAGDRSLVNLISHELAHSWSGNLVTNATWDDIWMNEGFTVYFERRISEALNGKSYADMLWELGYQDLEAEVKELGENSRNTWLKQDTKNQDADNALSDIPYEKGSLLLLLIEQNVGREDWDKFLNTYFDQHAFKSITTEQFLKYLDKYLLKGNKDLYDKIRINDWVYGPGIPSNAPRADMERFNKVNTQRDIFLKTNQTNILQTSDWTTHEWLHFLRKMPDQLSIDQMKMLDEKFQFTHSKNSEIEFQWFLMSINANYKTAFSELKKFLSITGRQKFIVPLYKAMMDNNKGDMAHSLYAMYKNNYHPIAQENLNKIIK